MFKVDELLKATKGRLVRAGKSSSVKGISTDSRTIQAGEAFIPIKGNNFDGHDFIDVAIKRGAKAVITQSLNCPITKSPKEVFFIQVKDTTKALGDIARSHRQKFDIPVIAVTGSNGKTTAKEMIASVLSRKYKVLKNEGTKNNHIGLPMTLLRLDNTYDFAVLEAGTNHPGEIGYLAKICRPNIGVITNVGQSHIEFLKDLDGVLREKYSLIRNMQKPNIALLNADDAFLKGKIAKKTKDAVIFSFGIRDKADFSASKISRSNQRIGFCVNNKYKFTLKALGYHNIYNALTAVSIGRLFGMEYRNIAQALSRFNSLENRLNLIRLNNIRFINDTYNSNPLSLKQALDALQNYRAKGRKIFVMGDMLELGKEKESLHYRAGRDAAGVCDVLVAVGELSRKAADGAKETGLKNIFICKSSTEARDILFREISPSADDIVLVKGSRSMKMEEVLKS